MTWADFCSARFEIIDFAACSMSTLNGKCISPTESWDLPTVVLSLSNCPASELTSGLNAENKIPVIGEVGFTAPQKTPTPFSGCSFGSWLSNHLKMLMKAFRLGFFTWKNGESNFAIFGSPTQQPFHSFSESFNTEVSLGHPRNVGNFLHPQIHHFLESMIDFWVVY